MRPAFFSRTLLRDYALSFLGWGSLALLIGSSARGNFSLAGWESVRPALRDWLPWAIVTPLLFRWVARFPIEGRHWYVNLALQMVTGAGVVMLAHGWRSGFYQRNNLNGDQRSPPPPDFDGEHGRRMQAPNFHSGTPLGPPPGHGFFDLYQFATFELPIYLMLLGTAHAALFHRRAQDREASLAHARLDTLRMQLQPHFLFNTLNTIAELVHEEPDKAESMIVSLSDLLRLTLESVSVQQLPLTRELESVRHYLELIQARWESRLQFSIEYPAEVAAAMVPAFLLQPLVENAIEHGLQPKTGGGSVKIKAWREGETLRVDVADDGVGLPPGATAPDGIGMGATRARLSAIHGRRATLSLRNEHGVTVKISMPFRTAANLITA